MAKVCGNLQSCNIPFFTANTVWPVPEAKSVPNKETIRLATRNRFGFLLANNLYFSGSTLNGLALKYDTPTLGAVAQTTNI